MLALDICNRSLAMIGINEGIGSFDDPSPTAMLCKDFYPQERDLLLASYPWSFAARRDKLIPWPGASDQFYYPQKCLSIVGVFRDSFFDTSSVQYDVVNTSEGKSVLVQGGGNYTVEFIYQQYDPLAWSIGFTDALCFRLASILCVPLTGNDQRANNLIQLGQDQLIKAMGEDARQRRSPAIVRGRYK